MPGGSNNRFYLRDHRNADRFKPNVTPPRLNFNGFVEFVFSPEARFLGGKDNGDTAIYREQISSLLQTASLPSMTFNTQIKNQYNIKRVVNTGVDYAPVELNVIDTVNNEWLVLIMKYFSYMYMNPRNKTEGETRDFTPKGYESASDVLVRNSNFLKETFDSNAAGLNIGTNPNFFDQIKMVVYHGGRGTEYILFKPTLTQFNLGGIDYTSNEFRQFTLQFEYENFTINNNVNFKLSDQDKSRFEDLGDDVTWLWQAADYDAQNRNPIYGGSDTGRRVEMLGGTKKQRGRDPQ